MMVGFAVMVKGKKNNFIFHLNACFSLSIKTEYKQLKGLI